MIEAVRQTCDYCQGSGVVTFDHPNDPSAKAHDCPECDGQGAWWQEVEQDC